jgi:transposase
MAVAIVESTRPVTGGVDTHLDVHVAAALDATGGVLGVESFPATRAGYASLASWLAGFGPVERVGVEGTGADGAGLARHLRRLGVEVIEVDRPNRQLRRAQGKSDTLDAIEAARAVLSGRARGVAKTADGNVEAMRVLEHRGATSTASQSRRAAHAEQSDKRAESNACEYEPGPRRHEGDPLTERSPGP